MVVKWLRGVVPLVCVLIFQGCASFIDVMEFAPGEEIELQEVPFFPQKEHQCGPASVSMLLVYAGAAVSPEDVQRKTYVPGIKGSLQPEMVAAARHFGRIPYVVDPSPKALLDELRQGHPVMILQNYGLDSMPAYHYAVVIGIDAGHHVILRSGKTRRMVMPLSTFMMSWKRPGSWGMVVLRPGELPARPSRDRYLKEVAAFEDAGYSSEATAAYTAALEEWPEDELVKFALANNYLSLGRSDSAAQLYKQILRDNPDHLAAANNLAETFLRKGCLDQARGLIENAVTTAHEVASPFLEQLEQTFAEIQKTTKAGVRHVCD